MLTFANYRLPTSALALSRIWFAMGALLLGVAPDPSWMTNYPVSFWRPSPGIGQLWGGVPPLSVIVGLRMVLVLALFALLVGWRTRFTSILVLFHISNALVLDINFAIFTLAYLPVLLLLFDDAVLDRACTYGENLVKKVVRLRRVAVSAGLVLAFVSWRGGLHLGIGDFLIPISLPMFVWLVKRDRLRVDGVPAGSVQAADGRGTGVVEGARQLPEGVLLPAAQLQMRLATHSFWLRLR